MDVITASQFTRELGDREAIRDCLCRYSRGVDRCDEEMLRSVYWEDAYDDHSIFSGTREELIAWVLPLLRGMVQSQHAINNILIRLQGDTADVESYFYGYHRIPAGDTYVEAIQSGRYLDKFEKRNDQWRIIRRYVMVDWFRDHVDAADWERGPLGQKMEFGGRHPKDLSYTMLKLT